MTSRVPTGQPACAPARALLRSAAPGLILGPSCPSTIRRRPSARFRACRDRPGNDERETKLAAMSPRILRAVTIENFGNEGRQRVQEIGSLPPALAHHSPVLLVSADVLLQ